MDFLSPPLPTRRRDASSPVSKFFTEQADADVFFPRSGIWDISRGHMLD